jgi:hypothetical protein
MDVSNIDIGTGTTGSVDVYTNESTEEPLTIQESLLNDSRITPSGNGNLSSKPYCTQPTGGQKWWAAVILGFIFALISSYPAYYLTSEITTAVAGVPTINGTGPTFLGLVIHTIVFILIIRIILW